VETGSVPFNFHSKRDATGDAENIVRLAVGLIMAGGARTADPITLT